MPQIFSFSSNSYTRVGIIVGLITLVGVGGLLFQLGADSSYATNQGVARVQPWAPSCASRSTMNRRDFTVGYSPERINPGDRAHRFETIHKVVSGQDAEQGGGH